MSPEEFKKIPKSKSIKITPQLLRNLMISTLIISFIVGGVSGILFASWLKVDSNAAKWVQETLFGQSGNSVDEQLMTVSKTLQILEESATIDVVKKSNPAVVSIVVTQDLSELYNLTGPNVSPFDELFDFRFQNPQGRQEVGAGTGFIVSSDGMILTNKHVVADADADYTVLLNDGTQLEASIIDTDPFNDLALIKIEGENFSVLGLGDSDVLKVGQTVIAIGNTLGEYNNSVTRGIISGLSRTVTAGGSSGQSETLEDIIQTDAAINFGNSGGPLINLAGQVIGVNTAISREGQLIGFAIPINQAKIIIDSVLQYGRIVRPYLGVRYILINDDVAERNDLDVNYGALIVKGDQAAELAIVPDSPASLAGLIENDIILEVDGQRIDRDHSLAKELQKHIPGDIVTLKVLSQGDEKIIKATLAELEDE